MTSSSGGYWRARAKANGHTGWADPVIYGFDQPARLEALSALLPRNAETALDVGCGTGDFSRLLLAHGSTVVGMDPYIKPRIRHPRFTYIESRQQVSPVALCVAITTLGMITDDSELAATLRWIGDSTRTDGELFLLEHCRPASGDPAYLKWRTEQEWIDRLESVGFIHTSTVLAPDPVGAPSPAFQRYRRDRWVRAVAVLHRATRGRLTRARGTGHALHGILRTRARSAMRLDPGTEPSGSSTVILRLRKT